MSRTDNWGNDKNVSETIAQPTNGLTDNWEATKCRQPLKGDKKTLERKNPLGLQFAKGNPA